MLKLYKAEWDIFKQYYARIFIWVFSISIVSAVIAYIALVNEPETTVLLMEKLGEQLQSQAERFGALDGSSSKLFLFIVTNNLYVSALVLVLGFIPLVILPFLTPFVTVLSISIMLAGFHIGGQGALKAFLAGILPHGVLEIIGILLVSSIGIYVSLQIAKKLFSSRRGEIALRAVLWRSIRSFLLVVVPFIVIAALIEGYITPLLMSLVY